MAILDDVLKGNILGGLAIGIGAAIVGPVVLPVIAGIAKPLAKGAIKSGLLLFEKWKETVAEMSEVFEDIVAEAKAEIEEAQQQAAPVVAPGAENNAV